MSDVEPDDVISEAAHGDFTSNKGEQQNVVTNDEPDTFPVSEMSDALGGDGFISSCEVHVLSDVADEETVVDEGNKVENEETNFEIPESEAVREDAVDMDEEVDSQVSDVKMQLLSKLKFRLENLGKTKYFCHDCGINCDSQMEYVQHTSTTEHTDALKNHKQHVPEKLESNSEEADEKNGEEHAAKTAEEQNKLAVLDAAIESGPVAEQTDVEKPNTEERADEEEEEAELELSRLESTSETEDNDADCYIEIDAEEEDTDAAAEEKSSVYYCEACDVMCRTVMAYYNHTRGLTHIMKAGSTTNNSGAEPQTEADVFYCATCDVKCENEMAYNNHTRGMTHTMKSGQVDAAKLAAKSEKKPPIVEAPIEPDQQFVDKLAKDSFYCEVCDCCMTGPQSFQMHLDGVRHKKNVKHRSVGAPISRPGGKSAMATGSQISIVVDRPPKIQHLIDTCKEPVIGMQFLCEYRQEREDVAPRYLCNLCEAVCDMRLIMQHLTGYKHRLAYMRKCHMNYAVLVQTSSRKSVQSKTIEKFAQEIEEMEGRQSMVVRLEGSFPGNTMTMGNTGVEGRSQLEETISSGSGGGGRRSRSGSIDRFPGTQQWNVVDDADDGRKYQGHRQRSSGPSSGVRHHSSRYSPSPRRDSRGPPRYSPRPRWHSPDGARHHKDRRSQEYHSPGRYHHGSHHVSEVGPWPQDLPDIERQRYDRGFEEWHSSEQTPVDLYPTSQHTGDMRMVDWNSRKPLLTDKYHETAEYPDEGRPSRRRHRRRHSSESSRSRSHSRPRHRRHHRESHRDRSRSHVTISSSSSQSPPVDRNRSDLQSWNKHCEKFLKNLDRERGEKKPPILPLPSVGDNSQLRMPTSYVQGPGAQAVLSGVPPRAMIPPPGYPPFYFPPHPSGPFPPHQFPGPLPYPYAPSSFPPAGPFPRGVPPPISQPLAAPPPAGMSRPMGPTQLMNMETRALPPTRGSTVYVSDTWNDREAATNDVRRVQPSESSAIRSAMAAVLADAVLMLQQKLNN